MIILNGKIVEFKKFPNNETYFNINELSVTLVSINTIVLKYESDLDLWNLLFLTTTLREEVPKIKIRLVIPYLPYSRMDRDIEDYPFSLSSLANILNTLNFTEIYSYDIHSDVSKMLINKFINVPMTKSIITKLNINIDDSDYVFYPDKGAMDRFNFGFKKVLYAEKTRDLKTGEIISYEIKNKPIDEDLSNKKVFIIDDLCSAGGTFMRGAKLLSELGFKDIRLITTHMENTMFKNKQLLKNDLIKKIYTTNSILDDALFSHKKVEVLDVYKDFIKEEY